MNSPLEPPRRSLTGAVVPALAIAALAALAALVVVGKQGIPAPVATTPSDCVMDGLEHVGGPISLTDVNGAPVTQADFSSGPAVIYFGYSHCPENCQAGLVALGRALESPEGRDIQSILITVDPERDTGMVLREYVRSAGFPIGLTALNGAPDQVKAAADTFEFAYQKLPNAADPASYNIELTPFLYVVDEQWRVRARLPAEGASAETIAACLSAALQSARA